MNKYLNCRISIKYSGDQEILNEELVNDETRLGNYAKKKNPEASNEEIEGIKKVLKLMNKIRHGEIK